MRLQDKFDECWKETAAGCWEWQRCKTRGYGSLFVDGKGMLAHRYSWQLRHGPIPDGMFICHHCDNPSCVNPKHLFLGTAADNVADMYAKERQNRPHGDRHCRAKLRSKDIPRIRSSLASGATVRALSAEFGVSYHTIHQIKLGNIWKSVP